MARVLLRSGLVDELRVDVMPVLLGGGLRFLEDLDPRHLRLEKIGVQDVGPRTSVTFQVTRGDGASI